MRTRTHPKNSLRHTTTTLIHPSHYTPFPLDPTSRFPHKTRCHPPRSHRLARACGAQGPLYLARTVSSTSGCTPESPRWYGQNIRPYATLWATGECAVSRHSNVSCSEKRKWKKKMSRYLNEKGLWRSKIEEHACIRGLGRARRE